MEIGFKSGMLTYLEDIGSVRNNSGEFQRMVKCRCICDKITLVPRAKMLAGKAVSCGCSKIYNNVVHTHKVRSSAKERYVWSKMKSRCLCPTDSNYVNYGGRGITLCDKWLSYAGFIEDMGSSYKEGLSLDRIDNNGNYCKENCRWTDRTTQSYNKRKLSTNKSGKTGVCWNKSASLWVVYFSIDKTKKYIGSFNYLWDAIYTRMQKEQEFYGYVKD